MMNLHEIRNVFLQFFSRNHHAVLPSSLLIPSNDPSLLFTNSGMVQFKDIFLGLSPPSAGRRVATAQRCLRAGGKHNDLENVGYTARHHTFFEMLGNFSFGDYFKKEAIEYAWELLIKVYRLPENKLWATVYESDEEAYDIWQKVIGLPPEKIVRIGDRLGEKNNVSDNFWQMADTGPCGPCSEIFYDHGPEVEGGPPGSFNAEGDRFTEIWNLVFMQFNRDEAGDLSPLPMPCVDTGMGLERMTAVMQGVHNNYDIDLFKNLISSVKERLVESGGTHTPTAFPLRAIADHIRASCFLVADGVLPNNEGRGYVLRRIIRRALRHGYQLGCHQLFFCRLVEAVDAEMGTAYPELRSKKSQVEKVLQQEEERFSETLRHGMGILNEAITNLKIGGTLNGETVFKLYDTYGFPVDLTSDICRESGISIDEKDFQKEMDAQKIRARRAGKFRSGVGAGSSVGDDFSVETIFCGYKETRHQKARILAIKVGEVLQSEIEEGESGLVILDVTPFYAESGGQVGDIGDIQSLNGFFRVSDTQKSGKAILHVGLQEKGKLRLGDEVAVQIDSSRRKSIARNHSATHLLHWALRSVLGSHVQQKGSLVDAVKTRFDFSHPSALSSEEIIQLENLVNGQILENGPTKVSLMPFDQAVSEGAVALFGEKYADKVRVLEIGESKELCGGTHVINVGDIGFFKILSETGIASGVRRIEAVTGENTWSAIRESDALLEALTKKLKVPTNMLYKKTEQLCQKNRKLEQEIDCLRSSLAISHSVELKTHFEDFHGVSLLVKQLVGADASLLKSIAEDLKKENEKSILVLASVEGERVHLVGAVGNALHFDASLLIKQTAAKVGGKGGGQRKFAQGSGTLPDALPDALASVRMWLEQQVR